MRRAAEHRKHSAGVRSRREKQWEHREDSSPRIAHIALIAAQQHSDSPAVCHDGDSAGQQVRLLHRVRGQQHRSAGRGPPPLDHLPREPAGSGAVQRRYSSVGGGRDGGSSDSSSVALAVAAARQRAPCTRRHTEGFCTTQQHPPAAPTHPRIHPPAGVGVHAAGGLIQHHHRGVPEERQRHEARAGCDHRARTEAVGIASGKGRDDGEDDAERQ